MNVKMLLSRFPNVRAKCSEACLRLANVHIFLKACFPHMRNVNNELVMAIKVNALYN